jgi:ribonuclease HI
VNPKAGIGIYFAEDSPFNACQPLPAGHRLSNNAAEIAASTEALRICKSNNRFYIEIRTDSKFLLGCILQHLSTWKKNGWVKTNKKPVNNREELENLDKVLEGLTVRWVYVAGHSNEKGNDCADFLARYATFKQMRKDNPLYFQQ